MSRKEEPQRKFRALKIVYIFKKKQNKRKFLISEHWGLRLDEITLRHDPTTKHYYVSGAGFITAGEGS